MEWTEAVTPGIDLPREGGNEGYIGEFEPLETVVLKRGTRLKAESIMLVEIHRDLLDAYIVTRSVASVLRAPRSVAVPCADWDAAIVEAGALIHEALTEGYSLRREPVRAAQL